MSLGVCNTITKYGDNRETRGYLPRRDLKQSMLVSSNFSDSVLSLLIYLLFQSYVHGIGPLPHFKLPDTHFLWLFILTIGIWL